MGVTPSINHSVVGADKHTPSHPEIEYPEKFYSCCKCFATEYKHKGGNTFHKICCYIYTDDGTLWMGYYDYSEPNGDIYYHDVGEICSPDVLCCCCSQKFIHNCIECKCLQNK